MKGVLKYPNTILFFEKVMLQKVSLCFHSVMFYLYELIDSVKVIVSSSSLLRNQTLLKCREAAVHIMLQARLQVREEGQ